jgi:cysteine-rich repeat protein
MKIRISPYALTALVLVGGGVGLLECSGGKCGNGSREHGEQCDKGDQNGVDGSGCSTSCQFANISVASIQVSYSKLLQEVPGFDGVPCNDLGIGGAHVVLAGPQGADETWMGCMQSKMYPNVPPGTYQATITLLDANMSPLTNAVTTAMTDVQKGPITNLAINFKQHDFVKQDYTGLLDWNPSWAMAGQSCAAAGVMQEALILKDPQGQPVTMPTMTSDGLKVDGTFGPCFSKDSNTLFERIGPLPWGHYTLTIVGKSMGSVSHCKAFELFLAPGSSTPTYELVVDSADANADGGVACP